MNQPTTTKSFANPEADQYDQYRTLSFSAIVTFVFGLIAIPTGLLASLNPFLLALPFAGILIGILSVWRLKNRQQEFTGYELAKIGLGLSTLLLLVGVSHAIYTYVTEVPEDCQRVTFTQLQPDPKYPYVPFAPTAADINDQKIFVKGYVYPDDQLGEIKRFILVPDFGACCFGGKPKLTDMMQVTLEDPHRVKYSYFNRSLSGTFRLRTSTASKVGEVVYHLEDAVVIK